MNLAHTRLHRTIALIAVLAAGGAAIGMAPETTTRKVVNGRTVLVRTPAQNHHNANPEHKPEPKHDSSKSNEHNQQEDSHESNGAHWSYEGKYSPENWGSLSDCEECDEGAEQSPVNIPAGMPTHEPDIEFSYAPMELNLVNNGHTVQVDASRESSIEVEDEEYTLVQFHFHSLSEHTLDGQHRDMEVHFVHKSDDGKYAVVAVFLERGEFNPAFAPVFSNMPGEPGESIHARGVAINTIDLLPLGREYYRYDGSFTTPPCTEGVKWFVMDQAVQISPEQMSSFTTLYDNNFRPVQPIGDRKFIAGSSSCECCRARRVLSSFGAGELSE